MQREPSLCGLLGRCHETRGGALCIVPALCEKCPLGGIIGALGKHQAFTIPHLCLFLPPLTKQFGVPARRV